mmetsp:Transcript_40469/g.90969  ORF Transcript_40469/g.90969 Transcript_40469/m.90969 type:complete len:170 (+) Transcript_40469:187-696(+)
MKPSTTTTWSRKAPAPFPFGIRPAFAPAQAQELATGSKLDLFVRPCMSLSNPAISVAFRWRFGLALVHDPSLRCACGEQIESEGGHFQRCLVGGHHITRHHALHGATASLFRQVAVVQEERYASSIGPVHPGDTGLRLDIVADDGHTCSSTTHFMADVTITHPVSSNQA